MKKSVLCILLLGVASCATNPNNKEVTPYGQKVDDAIRLCSLGASYSNSASFNAVLGDIFKSGNGSATVSTNSEYMGALLKIPGITPENVLPILDKTLPCVQNQMAINSESGSQTIIVGSGSTTGNIEQSKTQ